MTTSVPARETVARSSPRGFSGANVGDAANLTLPLAALAQLVPERAPQLESGSQWLRVLARPRVACPK